jgi:hypothetical protein
VLFYGLAFADLVKNVLLPMTTKVRVIHPDIRPGLDITSNFLYNLEDNDKSCRQADRLRKLNLFLRLESSLPQWQIYQKYSIWNVIAFVWWQKYLFGIRLLAPSARDANDICQGICICRTWCWIFTALAAMHGCRCLLATEKEDAMDEKLVLRVQNTLTIKLGKFCKAS